MAVAWRKTILQRAVAIAEIDVKLRGLAGGFEGVRTEITRLRFCKVNREVCEHAPAENVSNSRAQKCRFLRFP